MSKKQTTPKTTASAISASWNNPAVRAARVSRVRVKVGKETYPSMAYALAEHTPWLASRVISLRMKLRAEGSVEVEGKVFRLAA